MTSSERATHRRRLARLGATTTHEHVARILARTDWCGQDWLTFRSDGEIILAPWTCGKKFCASCLMTWSDSLRDRMQSVAGKIPPQDLRHIVLTVPNAPAGELQARTRALFQSYREWRNQGRRVKGGAYWRGVEGQAWKLEAHWSKTGWHPHLHVLAHAPAGVDLRRGDRGREAWARITATHGAPASFRDGIWITRPTDQASVAAEVAKYAAKPIPIRDLPLERLEEAITAWTGTHFQASSGTLALPPAKQPGDGIAEFLGNARTIVGKMLARECSREEYETALQTIRAVEYRGKNEPLPARWRSLLQSLDG